jgi:hypothetical protein
LETGNFKVKCGNTNSMKLAVLWNVKSCTLVEIERSLIDLMMVAVSTSEKSVTFNETAGRNIPQCHFHNLRENLKTHPLITSLILKFRVFWDVAPCSYVEVDRRFRGTYCIHHLGDDDRGSRNL